MKKTVIALLMASLSLPLFAGDRKEDTARLDTRVMNDTYQYDARKQCWRAGNACLKMPFGAHSVMTRQGETVYLRASGPVRTAYSASTMHSLIVYQPIPNDYRIIDRKLVRTVTYGHNGDGGKYPQNRFMQFGPDSYGWMLVGLEHDSDGPAQFGTIYALEKGHLKSLGAVSVIYDDGESKLKCTVDTDKQADTAAGYFPLTVHVTGQKDGRSVNQSIRLPFSPKQHQYDVPDGFICGN